MSEGLAINEIDRLISSDKVDGTTVYNSAGDKLGSIRNFMVEKRSGRTEYAVLEFGGFLGIGTDHYPIPWSMLSYDTGKGGYVANIDKSQLDNAPRYSQDQRPDYDESYGRSVHTHWGAPYATP